MKMHFFEIIDSQSKTRYSGLSFYVYQDVRLLNVSDWSTDYLG